MYSGLEVRVPFCDHRIVEYAYNMPWAFKALDGREKGIVRKAFERELPEEIVWRKKSPYPKTFHPVYTKLCADYVRRIFADSESVAARLFDTRRSRRSWSSPRALPSRGTASSCARRKFSHTSSSSTAGSSATKSGWSDPL